MPRSKPASPSKNPDVDAFFAREESWRPELEKLREILLRSGLEEELKWGQPCYALDGKNVALIHGFKEYCAILFHKGALLDDPKGVLVQQTKNVQSARQIRFTSLAEVKKLEGSVVRFEVTSEGFTLRAATAAEAKEHLEARRPATTTTPPKDLTKTAPAKLSTLSKNDLAAYGAKSVNAARACSLNPIGACTMSEASGVKARKERYQIETPSR